MTDIRIYQIDLDRDHDGVAFEPYASLSRWQDSPDVNASLYDTVFKGEIEAKDIEDVYRIFNKQAAPDKRYGGSTAYWMTRLKAVLIDGVSATDEEYHEILKGAVEAVDRENSTHLNSDGVGREEIISRVYSISRAKLIECLKDPEGTDLWLINYISEATHPTGKSQNGNVYKARTNVSFASKFCHYACFYLFEGKAEQDNYSIFDYVLRKVLPKYITHYGIKNWNLDDYSEYRKAVDDILRKANARISRNGFDHLLWYYFKGRL